MDMDGLSVDHCSAQRTTTVHRSKFLPPVNWDRSIRGYKPTFIAVSTPNCCVACIAKSCGNLRNHVQHRLNVSRRTGNDSQDFTRCSLLLQRLLKLLEQPGILDGDHGLVSEGFEKLDLRRCERTHLGPTRGQVSDEFPLLTKGNGQQSM